MLRVRGRCLSRQVYVEAAPPGQNPGDRAAEATEDVLAAEAIEGGSSPPPTGLQVCPHAYVQFEDGKG